MKIAGARVGAIKELDVTPEKKAVVVLEIEEPGFAPFRADAKCTIRPQSLIGEKFVECDPGRSDQPELEEVPDGEDGEGQADAAAREHELAGGPRPDQQHHAAALPRAARDPDQRVRHRRSPAAAPS